MDTITTGVVGRPWRASITPWGAIEPWGSDQQLEWYVAAEDRWHIPGTDTTIRQHRRDHTPVVDTRLRVPGGDIVQTIYSTADAGGMTVVEFANRSPVPVVIALNHRDVLTDRPIEDRRVEGLDLPEGAFSMPVSHGAAVRVALVHQGKRRGRIPAEIASSAEVVKGWSATLGRASRLRLPNPAWTDAISLLRSELLLVGLPPVGDDPAGWVIGLGELVRLGEPIDPWLDEMVAAIAQIGPQAGWREDRALDAARRILLVADETRALGDLDRIIAGRQSSTRPDVEPDGVALIPWVERYLATEGALAPMGIPRSWYGKPVEVYGLPTRNGSAVSYALRWHGARPAILWEQSGAPITLSSPVMAPEWTTTESEGEALWPPPPAQ
ncbi:MAG: hypothetical protein CSA55_02725 [Ilumatobacter coccineus]|uniref:Uncharacterized protein n=1 Tax=Ilumatobacter coccineus TaxID=467094 RepID=A0A2G6KB93_9ACTN|nr:MAG: hypothetical protein CSA55_02725 [Ilumatobacter coccineus]